ncbi:MAG TPA: hypothetical protein VLJ79_09345 [Candidatus Binatia bacterium]|nr:hypothetical protein [Candidatus Binatia bacterium]
MPPAVKLLYVGVPVLLPVYSIARLKSSIGQMAHIAAAASDAAESFRRMDVFVVLLCRLR